MVVRGGQGRTARDIRESAAALAWFVVLFLALLATLAVTA